MRAVSSRFVRVLACSASCSGCVRSFTLTPFLSREMGVDGIYVRPVPTDRNDLGEP